MKTGWQRNWIAFGLLVVCVAFFVGCSDAPSKVVPTVQQLFQTIKQLSGAEGQNNCAPGQGTGSVQGILVDPDANITFEDLGTGSFDISFCGQRFDVQAQSLSAIVIGDASTPSWLVSVIGDFNSMEGPFAVIQTSTISPETMHNSIWPIDNESTMVYLVDGTFENILAYATSGNLNNMLGSVPGDEGSLDFEGTFESMPVSPPPAENAWASFEVTVNEPGMRCDSERCPPTYGTGNFTVDLGDTVHSFEGQALAFLYADCDDLVGPGEPSYDCLRTLEITIGDSDSQYMMIQVTEQLTWEDDEAAPVGSGLEAWATLYDRDYNVLAWSDIGGLVSSMQNGGPIVGEIFEGSFQGHMVGQNVNPPCHAQTGEGKGAFDTWLNRDVNSWAYYLGNGHLQLVMDNGQILDIGEKARATVYELVYDQESRDDNSTPFPEAPFLYIEIGELSGNGNGQMATISVPFAKALEGGEIGIGPNGPAWVSVWDSWYGQTLGEAISGSLAFNELGGQDGDLAVGHFNLFIENQCVNPPPPTCETLKAQVSTDEFEAIFDTEDSSASVSALGIPVQVNIDWVEKVWENQPIQIPAAADVYYDGLGLLSVRLGSALDSVYALVDLEIPVGDYYRATHQQIDFGLNSFARFEFDGFGVAMAGTLAGWVELNWENNLETGIPVKIKIQVTQVSNCNEQNMGCRTDSDCPEGQYCTLWPCDCLPDDPDCSACNNQYGECVSFENNCQTDEDCPWGTVCEYDDIVGENGSWICMPGCRDNSDCAPGQECNQVVCVRAPCPAQCIGVIESCPDPNDQSVHYISQDPTECAAILFECEDYQRGFSNECGCGCEDLVG